MLEIGKRYRVKLAMTLMAHVVNDASSCVMLYKDEFDVLGFIVKDNMKIPVVTNMTVDPCVVNPYKHHAIWTVTVIRPTLDMWDECLEMIGEATSLVCQEYV